MEYVALDDDLFIGLGEPNEQDFARFSESGFKTVIDLRTDSEEHLLSPSEEEFAASREGIAYHNFPVSGSSLDPERGDRFCELIEKSEKPVLVHCKAGVRCAAFSMMRKAVKNGSSAQTLLREASEMGFNCNSPFWLFAGRYVESQK